MNALNQTIYALVQMVKKTHHASLNVSTKMAAMRVNVQMATIPWEREYA